ncbi:protein of unknown function [Kyrpidia spormannii]|uniref:Uncharacterized protein n=2 Tax=Kyrpidia spormannii TaxID=2055160 RepID=A0ACA8ZD93_9BACL|nr:protein of unknown function [Kyrpidia spormannii]CAB3395800.1 protein of unknown function [Kyrpidia spormannii]
MDSHGDTPPFGLYMKYSLSLRKFLLNPQGNYGDFS